jgi:hypothetical protein
LVICIAFGISLLHCGFFLNLFSVQISIWQEIVARRKHSELDQLECFSLAH